MSACVRVCACVRGIRLDEDVAVIVAGVRVRACACVRACVRACVCVCVCV